MALIKTLRCAVSLLRTGPLLEDGWIKSYLEGNSINFRGDPIPWITYPAIDFLSGRLPRLQAVFEYGSGNGTLWWAARANFVTAVENDSTWYKQMSERVPANVGLRFAQLDDKESYERQIEASNEKYDVVIVDGRRRNKCIEYAISHLKEDGILILDNSDRPEYCKGIDFLKASGFRGIEFRGLCPIVNFKSETSIYYRTNNILGI